MGDGKPTDAEIAAANDQLLKRVLGILEGAEMHREGAYRGALAGVTFAALREREELMANLANVQKRCTDQENELRAIRRKSIDTSVAERRAARDVLRLLHALLSKTGPIEIDMHSLARGVGADAVESKSDDLKGTTIYFARDLKGEVIHAPPAPACKNHCIDFVCAACASRLMGKASKE